MAPTLFRGFRLGFLLALLPGCAITPRRVESGYPPCAARGIVFVVDGAGTRQWASRAITKAVDEQRLPLYVRSFDWTHGLGGGLADVVDSEYSHCQGKRLAEEIARYRVAYPGVPIYMVALSAGTGVALAAGEWLPPNAVEHIVLLAASISASYDLRYALASSRGGIDNFYSKRDRYWLGLGIAVVGTSDGKRGPAAGRIGFLPPVLAPCDAALAGRLRQHAWDESVAWTGNEGGHTESLQPKFLKVYVLPLLRPGP